MLINSNNAEVQLKTNETSESLIRRFKKKVYKSGCLEKYKEKMYFVKKSDKKRMEKKRTIFLEKKKKNDNK